MYFTGFRVSQTLELDETLPPSFAVHLDFPEVLVLVFLSLEPLIFSDITKKNVVPSKVGNVNYLD